MLGYFSPSSFWPLSALDVLVPLGVLKGKGGWLHRPPRLVTFRMTGGRRTD